MLNEKGMKPCPHCGGSDIMTMLDPSRNPSETRFAFCNDCGAEGPPVSTEEGRDEAIAAWNRRASPDAPEDVAGFVERLRAAHSVDTWHAAQEAASALTRIAAERDAFRRMCRESYDAFSAMRNDINEVIGDMASQESTLANGPEMTHECAAVTEAVTRRFATLRARIAELEGKVERPAKQFPILGGDGATIDWDLVADHGKQAQANHSQSVSRLAARGGLSWCELHAVLHNEKWRKMDQNEAMLACRALETRYRAARRYVEEGK